MNDPNYIEKLPKLFLEFQESDAYQGIQSEARFFKNLQDLLRKTPKFWNGVIKRLDSDCLGAYKYLAQPYSNGHNSYLEQVHKTSVK